MMAAYIYTIKNRETGEVLRQGTKQQCAEYIGTSSEYIRMLAVQDRVYENPTKFSTYKVERHVDGERNKGGSRKKDIICLDCGLLMENASAHRKRCPECALKYTRAQNLLKIRSLRNQAEASRYIPPLDTSSCAGCFYFSGVTLGGRTCNYIFIVGKRRPCPPGKDCTVRKPGTQIDVKEDGIDELET